MQRWWGNGVRGCLWLAALISAGCGGGGGGGGGGSGAGSNGSNAVVVGAPSPAQITAAKIVGDSMGFPKLTGTITGNLDSLAGKNVTVVVEDPAQLFASAGALVVTNTGAGATYELTLGGRPLTTAGHFTGKLRILACLDSACQQPLAGTPLSVPFDVTVQDGLSLSRQQIKVSVPFGTIPTPEDVNLDWASSANGWVAAVNSSTSTNGGYFMSVSPGAGAWSTAHQLHVQLMPAPPGTYTGTVNVRSTALASDNRSIEFDKSIAVNYTVSPNPDVDYGVWPAPSIELTHAASETLIRYYDYQLVLNTGVSASYLGVDYLSGAGTQGPANRWWQTFGNPGAYETCSGTECMVPGVYTAQMRYRLTSPKGTREITIPIRMTVTP